MILRMTNIKGLDRIPRGYSPEIPRHHVQYLEDIRRAGNAVRALRNLGKDTSAARFRMKEACERFDAMVSRETWERENPTLF